MIADSPGTGKTTTASVVASESDRKTNLQSAETVREPFCKLGIYGSNVIETTIYSIQLTVFAVKEKLQVKAYCCLKRFLKIGILIIVQKYLNSVFMSPDELHDEKLRHVIKCNAA